MGGLAALCLAWALALGCAHPLTHIKPEAAGAHPRYGAEPPNNDTALAQLCEDGGGFDATTLSDNGTLLLFRGGQVWEVSWEGVPGVSSRPIAASWPELGEGPVDAALLLPHREDPQDPQEPRDPQDTHSLYLFQGGQVWAYGRGGLRPGYPRPVGDEFPGVPEGVDAAVECPPAECGGETLLFFKGDTVFSVDVGLGVTKPRAWAGGPCEAALHWGGRHFCIRGSQFQRFHPKTGDVRPGPPRDLRDYFIPCPGRGHGAGNESWGPAGDPCSGDPIQALLWDPPHGFWAFRGNLSFQLPGHFGGAAPHAWPVAQTWPGLRGPVGAAFSWEGRSYLVQGSQVSAFLSGGRRPVQGYPRPLQEELGVSSIDAAFICPGSDLLYLITGDQLLPVDLSRWPRVPGGAARLPHAPLDAAACSPDGVFLLRGTSFHQYPSVEQLLGAAQPPPPRSIAAHFFRCSQ